MKHLIIGVLFLGAMVHEVAAWSGPITRPEFYAPKGCPPEVRQQIDAALNRQDCKFIEGIFFNFGASWRVDGNTFALNGFLQALSECPGVRMTITTNNQFRTKGDWSVYTHGVTEHFYFRIDINGKSERILQKALKIPSLHGPKLEIAETARVETLDFGERLELSDGQEKLLRLRKRAGKQERETVGPAGTGKEVADLAGKLGADLVVREVLANELVILPDQQPGASIIHNPTMENLVFHVAFKGGEILRGSVKMSVAH